ncbi:MAG: flagellar biosynthesis repressor FlbT [Nitrospirae bacterium]|jgi:flagellar protein FlbT|nr:flagellar biosynthesis repressor FlbT [Nitrospirota bacterium]
MALKISLKPQERIIIGGAVVKNGSARSILVIENDVPILREKDIMSEKDASTPCRRIYFVVQLMYIDEKNLREYHNLYWKLIRDLLKAAPSLLGIVDQISEYILANKYYRALKLARKLINYEEEVVNNVRNTTNRSL